VSTIVIGIAVADLDAPDRLAREFGPVRQVNRESLRRRQQDVAEIVAVEVMNEGQRREEGTAACEKGRVRDHGFEAQRRGGLFGVEA